MQKGKMLYMIIKKICYRCKGKDIGHTDKYLIDFYQASKKEKRKFEINLVDNSNLVDLTHLDVFDFFEDRKLSRPTD